MKDGQNKSAASSTPPKSGSLTPWKKGDVFSAAHLQQAVDAISAMRTGGQSGNGGNVEIPQKLFIGRLTNTGPAAEGNFTDERYWVKLQAIPGNTSGVSGSTDVAVTLADFSAGNDADGRALLNTTVCATNLCETKGHTHCLDDTGSTTGLLVTLWQEIDRDQTAPRVRWVFAQQPAPGAFPVRLSQTGGSAGDSSTQCSFSYTVKDITNTDTLGTGVSMTGNGQRIVNATMTAGTYGVAYYSNAGSIVLIWADERISQTNCPASFDAESDALSIHTTGGTAYSLTTTAAQVTVNGTDAKLTVPGTGQWLLRGRVNLKYNGATFAANRTVTIKLRRTNNTAADVTNATCTVITGVVTTITETFMVVEIPESYYTTVNTDDEIAVYASIDTLPSAGSLDITEASIVIEPE